MDWGLGLSVCGLHFLLCLLSSSANRRRYEKDKPRDKKGDPASIEFCEKTGLDYVSCSPFRVPIARLAAAQAALKSQGEKALHY